MNTMTIKTYIRISDFKTLFNELGWNYPDSNRKIRIDMAAPNQNDSEIAFDFIPVAERSGCRVFACEVGEIPTLTTCRKIDRQLQKYAFDYIAIYHIPKTAHHAWVVPVKRVEKRDLVIVEYESEKQADFLIQKLDHITFGYKEMSIADVREGIQAAFLVNSEKITKAFYTGFRKQHDQFSEFIQNLPDTNDRKWYTSVMLNRLMFCYFIQKKGFLDQNVDYLQDKLREVRSKRGDGKYYTFYRAFLRRLFSDGLNKPRHDREFEKEFGQIPYLNGGMFDKHSIEEKYDDLDIKDEAFERLFAFFDTYRWHLDTRITETGKDINPDVLGYIFEQYINDRAAMGAYYTKEDITEYIGKNCIVPYLLDALSRSTSETCKDFEPDGYVWQKMKDSGEKYIYDAVKKGYTDDWQKRIPEDIAIGLDTTKPNLLERRKHWNNKTPEAFALPTEIWRETIARLQRCEDLKRKIAAGEICHANDLITYNLDMRQFAYDLIAKAKSAAFVCDFFNELQKITILDPTCGSGAFLFAALNILEPLYEICIERMENFVAEHSKRKDAHLMPRFKEQIDKIHSQYRSNIQYYIYKTIILHNLYGVDIMPEAVEIAKLRLFLKLVAVVDVDVNRENLGLDPLPDIDFNIRCGNTLVGCSTESELKQVIFNDLFKNDEAQQQYKEIQSFLDEKVAKVYADFMLDQSINAEDMAMLKKRKEMLITALAKLNDILNHYYHKYTQSQTDFESWKTSHQPFHWLAEFYTIMKGNGGFDVIIGNPPYVVYKPNQYLYYVSKNYKTYLCKNLYAYIVEQCVNLSHIFTRTGYVVPISSVSNEQFKPLLKLYKQKQTSWHSCYSNRPGKLFDNVEQRLTITIALMKDNNTEQFGSSYNHWYRNERDFLYRTISYQPNQIYDDRLLLFKLGSKIESCICDKIYKHHKKLSSYLVENQSVYYHNAPTYFIRVLPYKPNSGEGMRDSSHYKILNCINRDFMFCVLNSSLFYWFYKNISNCRDFSDREIKALPVGNISIEFTDLAKKLEQSYIDNKAIKSRNYQRGLVYYEEYYPAKSKPIIDEIDKVLAKHYGFTEEELDFIINYDIKYRMGDELGDGEE